MKNPILCCAFCLGLGMVVGGVVVSNNSKIRNWLIKTQNKAADTYNDVLDKVDEKVTALKEEAHKAQATDKK